MAEKRRDSEGTEGGARQREKIPNTADGNEGNIGAKRNQLLNLNHCTARQLSLIQGVSREVGDRIVATRRRLGGTFQYFDQLHTIKGVTRAVIQALRGNLQVPEEEATPIGEPEGYMRLGPVQSQASLLSLNSLGDMVRRKAEKDATVGQMKSPKPTRRRSYGGKKRSATKPVSTPRKAVKVPRNVSKTPIVTSKVQGKSTKTHARSPKTPARTAKRIANKSVEGKSRLVKTPKSPKVTRKLGNSPVSSRRPPNVRSVKTPAKRPAKKTGASASRSRSRTPRRVAKSSAKKSSSKPPRPSPRGKKEVSVSSQAKRKKTSRRAPPSRKPVTYKVVTSSSGESTWAYSSRRRASNPQPPVLVLKIETSPTQQTSAETAFLATAVATSKTPQTEAEEISVSSGSRSRTVTKKPTKKRAEEPSVEISPDSASATAGSKTPAVPSTTAGGNIPTAEVGKDPTKFRSRASVEAVEKWLESTARYSTDLQQDPGQVDDHSSRPEQPGMEDITSEYKSAYAYPPSTAPDEQAKSTQLAQTESQGWNVEGNQTRPSPEVSSAQDADGNNVQGNKKEETSQPVAVEQVEASAEAVATPTGRRRRRRHRHRRSRDEPSPKRRRRSVESGSYPTCNLL
ncbi:nucleolar protein dao-5-like [Branchiostoma lanceolatum]